MATEIVADLAVRVLFAGACQGQFSKLLKKVEKVNIKNGPFDALICVGQFFTNEEEAETESEFIHFLNSGQRMPITTYILGAYGKGYVETKEKIQEMDCNVHFLGKRGLFILQNGLSIAYLEGVYDSDHFEANPSMIMTDDKTESQFYTLDDVQCLKNLIQSRTGEIDFFLTCDWPADITSKLPPPSIEGPIPKGSQAISSLLTIIRPRYHFTSQPPLFFSRLPYKNPDLGAGSHVTRFTSLCPFGGGKKQNLFALCLTPAQYMSQEKLLEIPFDATEFPFESGDRKRDLETKVKVDMPVVANTSCTPPSQPDHHLMNAPSQWLPLSAGNMIQVAPFHTSYYPSSTSTSPVTPKMGTNQFHNAALSTRSQIAVQTLMQNIGRGSMIGGSPHMDIDSCIGGDGALAGGRNYEIQNVGLNLTNNSIQPETFMTQSSFASSFGPMVMNSSNLNRGTDLDMHFAQQMKQNWEHLPSEAHSDQNSNFQNLLLALLQDSQLLSSAISMGLLSENLVNALLAKYQSTLSQADMTNTLANHVRTDNDMNFTQPQITRDLSGKDQISDHPMDTQIANAHALSNTKIGEPSEKQQQQQTKRYKTTLHEKNKNVIKDKRKTCFVGQLPNGTSRDDIINFFAQAGEVAFVVKPHNDDGNDPNWAFVQFTSQEARAQAIEMLDQAVFKGRKITVRPANDELKYNPNEPVNDCWFCLGSPSSDKVLIVSIGNECYLAVDKGPITDNHVLIIPTSHYPSTLRLTESCYQEMEQYLNGLRAMFATEGRAMIAFERYLQTHKPHGNHTHISVISIDSDIAPTSMDAFIQMDDKRNGVWSHLALKECGRKEIRDIVGDEEYFLVILPDGSRLVRPILKNSRLPVSFGRDVLAQLVGSPERADWKICLSSQEDEKIRVENFKMKFQPFDIPNQS